MEQVRSINNGVSELTFWYDGSIKSFSVNGEDKLNADEKSGFYLLAQSGEKIYPNDAFIENDCLNVVFGRDDNTRFIFEIHKKEKYIGFELIKVLNLPKKAGFALIFRLMASGVKAVEHKYSVRPMPTEGGIMLSWDGLSYRAEPLGGFSLYTPVSKEDEDETLYAIWGNENISHPKCGVWNEQKAREWIQQIKAEFKGSAFIGPYAASIGIEASNESELYECTDYAIKYGVDAVYLMPWVWRDGFWPIGLTNDGVNTKVFPKGEEDLKRYSDYLKANGIKLHLHNVSGGIGFVDPAYVRPKIDSRLASWGHGTLVKPISKSDTTLYFKPDKDTELPFAYKSYLGPISPQIKNQDVLQGFFGYNVIAIENELIRVGTFKKTDEDIWELNDCMRSFGDNMTDGISPVFVTPSTNTPHDEGTPVRCLVDTYGINLLPDPNSDLLKEQALRYADNVINKYEVRLACYDGFEIHDFFGPFFDQKYADIIYTNTVNPTTVITSYAVEPRCYFEHRFNCIRGDSTSLMPYCADLRLHRPSWTASTLTAVNFLASNNVANGINVISVRDHHCGMNVDILKKHGLAEATFELLNDWFTVSTLLSDEQKETLKRREYPHHYLRDSGNHTHSPLINTLTKTDKNYIITPHTVNGIISADIYAQKPWTRFGQEQGVVEMRQYLRVGEKIALDNIFAPQEPTFICRVMNSLNNYDKDNIKLLSGSTKLTNPSDTIAVNDDSGLSLRAVNPLNKPNFNEEKLISWTADAGGEKSALWDGFSLRESGGSLDMSSHRGIGMTIEGDGSNSVLVVGIVGRDYPVLIDFTGEKDIIIPCGEYAWTYPSWGWRFCTWKYIDYSKVSTFYIGYGRLNPNSKANIKVKNLCALQEKVATLVNPTFCLGDGELRVLDTVRTDEQISFSGGDKAQIFDLNWNLLRTVNVSKNNFVHYNGATLSVKADNNPSGVWLEYAQQTKDESKAIVLKK